MDENTAPDTLTIGGPGSTPEETPAPAVAEEVVVEEATPAPEPEVTPEGAEAEAPVEGETL